MYFLELREPFQNGLPRILAEKLDETRDILRELPDQPELSVHGLRKNIKRIRALLRLGRLSLGESQFRQENIFYRDFGRLFCTLRDAAVLFETAASLAAAGADAPEGPGFSAVVDRLERQKLDTYLGIAQIGGLLETADRLLSQAMMRWPALVFSDETARYRVGFMKTAGDAERHFRRVRKSLQSAHEFHELRKQVKYLWHQCEILSQAVPVSTEERIGDLQHLAGLLGLAHDAVALQIWLDSQGENLPAEEAGRLRVRLRRFRLDQEGAALAHCERIFSSDAVEFAAGFPLLNDYPVPSD